MKRVTGFRNWWQIGILLGICLAGRAPNFALGATESPLHARGYSALPAPQKVTLGSGDFEFNGGWRVETPDGNVSPAEQEHLRSLLMERFHLAFTDPPAKHGGVLRLIRAPNSVAPSGASKRNSSLAEQAYRLTLAPRRIVISGNTATGLFYGMQTFAQLLKQRGDKLWLPEGEIEDWPDLKLRIIYWDDAHHIERLDVLKAALRQAAFYKINGFAIKLEGHFQYAHAKPIVEPYALTDRDLQELTDYARRYHVELIPYLDAPAHDAFILKHAAYARLREYSDNNYEFCLSNPETYSLVEGMFDDLLAATKGAKYVVLSTDEAYYVGQANSAACNEAERARYLGSRGKLLAEFVTKVAGHLHDQGREVIFWGEYPLNPDDIESLPSYLINGEVYGPQFDPLFRARGIQQMVYTYTEAEEQLFPNYYILPAAQRLHDLPHDRDGRVQQMLDSISFTSLASLSSMRPDAAQPNQADVIGTFVAGWGDPGLHPETFWLGYATGAAAAWHRGGASAQESQSAFYSLFYGSDISSLGRLYQLMSEGAQFWEDSWETGPSAARTPIWGNSVGQRSQPARDQYLSLPPVPLGDLLQVAVDWSAENRRRIELAGLSLQRNGELLDLLFETMTGARFNRYNLEVFLSLARLYRQNAVMIQDLGRISEALRDAGRAAGMASPEAALVALDRALDLAAAIRQYRNSTIQDLTGTWYKTWLPRVLEANGRTYLDQVDDVKDHQPVRTVTMTYLIYRQLLYPLGDWARQTTALRNNYAVAHGLSERRFDLKWESSR